MSELDSLSVRSKWSVLGRVELLQATPIESKPYAYIHTACEQGNGNIGTRHLVKLLPLTMKLCRLLPPYGHQTWELGWKCFPDPFQIILWTILCDFLPIYMMIRGVLQVTIAVGHIIRTHSVRLRGRLTQDLWIGSRSYIPLSRMAPENGCISIPYRVQSVYSVHADKCPPAECPATNSLDNNNNNNRKSKSNSNQEVVSWPCAHSGHVGTRLVCDEY